MVMQTLRIGDLAEGQKFTQPNSIRYNGMQCEVIADLKVHRGRDRVTGRERIGLGYRVLWANGNTAIVRPRNLKFSMKRPMDKKIPWEDCAWSPHPEPKS